MTIFLWTSIVVLCLAGLVALVGFVLAMRDLLELQKSDKALEKAKWEHANRMEDYRVALYRLRSIRRRLSSK